MLMRYATLMALAASAVWGALNLGASNAQMFLVDAGQLGLSGQGVGVLPNVTFWALAAVATLITLSLCRFVLFGLPSMVDGWYQARKSWIYTLIIGGLIYGAFHLI
jgi:hypothetical protein